jgi:hypothetical protein
MSTPKHTPGPWTAEQDTANKNDRFILSGRNGAFSHWQGWAVDGVTTEEEDAANARLIAAAPDLLGACRVLYRIAGLRLRGDPVAEVALANALAAIEKAEGSAPA